MDLNFRVVNAFRVSYFFACWMDSEEVVKVHGVFEKKSDTRWISWSTLLVYYSFHWSFLLLSKKWNQRYFIFTNRCLRYWDSENDFKMKKKPKQVRDSVLVTFMFDFESKGNERMWYLHSEAISKIWVESSRISYWTLQVIVYCFFGKISIKNINISFSWKPIFDMVHQLQRWWNSASVAFSYSKYNGSRRRRRP